jgi:hypothetical protein
MLVWPVRPRSCRPTTQLPRYAVIVLTHFYRIRRIIMVSRHSPQLDYTVILLNSFPVLKILFLKYEFYIILPSTPSNRILEDYILLINLCSSSCDHLNRLQLNNTNFVALYSLCNLIYVPVASCLLRPKELILLRALLLPLEVNHT